MAFSNMTLSNMTSAAAPAAQTHAAKPAKPKNKHRITKVVLATLATLGIAIASTELPETYAPLAYAALTICLLLLVYYVLALVFSVRNMTRFTFSGLAAVMICSLFFHWFIMMFLDGATGAHMYDTGASDFAEKSMLYSLDQTVKGLTFDILEGLRIDMVYIFDKWFGIETAMIEPPAASGLAVFDAIYRSLVTGIAVTYLAGLMKNMLGWNRH